MKTSTLTGADLNRAVAMALGHKFFPKPDSTEQYVKASGQPYLLANYSGEITAAWPIIVSKRIDLRHTRRFSTWSARIDRASVEQPPATARDADAIVAAMRCFVASVYGDDVEMP